jgi:hypothetical protein
LWIHKFDLSDFRPTASERHFTRSGNKNADFTAEEFRLALQIRLGLSDLLINEGHHLFYKVVCGCGRALTPETSFHLFMCTDVGTTFRHNIVVKIITAALQQANIPVQPDKSSPKIRPGEVQADFETTAGGEIEAYDVRVVSPHTDKYQKGGGP